MRCPVCKRKITRSAKNRRNLPLVTPRYEGVMDIPMRSNPYIMHKECAEAYNVTERLMLSTGQIKSRETTLKELMESISKMGQRNMADLIGLNGAFGKMGTAAKRASAAAKRASDAADALALNLYVHKSRSANKNTSSAFQILGQRADMIIIDDVESGEKLSTNSKALLELHKKQEEYYNNAIAKAMGIPESVLKFNLDWETTVKPLQAVTNTIGVIRSDIKS